MFFCGKAGIYNRQYTDNTLLICDYWDFRGMWWDPNKQDLKPDYTFCFQTSLGKYTESLPSPSKPTTCHILLAQTRSLAPRVGTQHAVLCTPETRHLGAQQRRASAAFNPSFPYRLAKILTMTDNDSVPWAVQHGAQLGWSWRVGQALYTQSLDHFLICGSGFMENCIVLHIVPTVSLLD